MINSIQADSVNFSQVYGEIDSIMNDIKGEYGTQGFEVHSTAADNVQLSKVLSDCINTNRKAG